MKSALELLRELRRDGNSFSQSASAKGDDGPTGSADQVPDTTIKLDGIAGVREGRQIRQNRQNLVGQIPVLPTYVSRFWSEVLSEEILVVPDDVPVVDDIAACGRIVYKHSEVHSLLGWTPAGLRLIHDTKRVFGGDVLPDQDTPPEQFVLSGMSFPGAETENGELL